jgi:hypothetical protein
MEKQIKPFHELPEDCSWNWIGQHERYAPSMWAVYHSVGDDVFAYVLPVGLVKVIDCAEKRGAQEVRDNIKIALGIKV